MKKKIVYDLGGIVISLLNKNFLKMKLTVLCLLLGLVQLMANDGFSQSTKLTLDLKNARLEDVLMKIEEQSSFYFIYNRDVVNVNRVVDISCTGENMLNVLARIFNGTNVTFELNDRHIILKSSPAPISQQQKALSGIVTDSSGAPLPGVAIVVKGTANGTVTDVDGKYTFSNVPANAILRFSFVGMKPQEIVVGEKSTINIVLEEETIGIDEVIAVGYGTNTKKNLTTSISQVKTDDIAKAASSHMSQLLLGRASGLNASMVSAQPGGNVSVSIRGAGNPIYVVDGIVMPNSSIDKEAGATTGYIDNVNRGGLLGLNPEDIESVEILKDASASIYGIAAANGVILITTKKGTKGKMKVEYDGSYSAVTNYKYLKMLDAQQFMGLTNIFNKEIYLYSHDMAPYGPAAYDNGWSPTYDSNTITSAKTTDWASLVLRGGMINNHSIKINGGTESVRYYVSGNYYKENGTVSKSSMERYSLRSNFIYDFNSFMKLTSVMNVNRNNYDNSSVGGTVGSGGAQNAGALINALTYPSYLPVKDESGKYTVFRNLGNPVALDDMNDISNEDGVYLNFSLDVSLIKDMLSAKVLYGNNIENSKRSIYIPGDLYYGQQYSPRGTLGYDRRKNDTYEATVSFKRSFGDYLNLDAVVGAGRYINKSDGIRVAYNGQYDAIANDDLGSVSGTITPDSYRMSDEKRSVFARLNLDVLDRYVITATIRRDGTDKFFPGKKYANFPSVSAAWKVSNESFMKSIRWVDLLKVRASYGKTGIDNLGTILYGTLSPAQNYVYFNNNAQKYIPIILNSLDYPDVSWEKTFMKNIGIDFYLLNNTISGNFDIFRNDITDMLANVNSPGLSILGTYPTNGGHLRRQGWDASINTTNIRTQNFSWESLVNLSRYNSLWIERVPGYDYKEYESRGTTPQNARYYYESSGLINIDKSNIPASQPEAARLPGYPVIVDQNKDGVIDIKDIVSSNEVPDISIGLGNTFRYKNFDLDIFMYSQIGVNKYNFSKSWVSASRFMSEGDNSSIEAFDIWNSQTNTNGKLPGVAYSLASVSLPGGAGLALNYQDASFVRVRNITLGYNLSGNSLGDYRKYISSIRFYIDAQNPITITGYDGYDPEIKTGKFDQHGVDKAEYPQTRTFSVGVKVNF